MCVCVCEEIQSRNFRDCHTHTLHVPSSAEGYAGDKTNAAPDRVSIPFTAVTVNPAPPPQQLRRRAPASLRPDRARRRATHIYTLAGDRCFRHTRVLACIPRGTAAAAAETLERQQLVPSVIYGRAAPTFISPPPPFQTLTHTTDTRRTYIYTQIYLYAHIRAKRTHTQMRARAHANDDDEDPAAHPTIAVCPQETPLRRQRQRRRRRRFVTTTTTTNSTNTVIHT